MHHAKHLRKTEALKLAAQKLKGKKRNIEEEPISRSPKSDLIDIIDGNSGEVLIHRDDGHSNVIPINEMYQT